MPPSDSPDISSDPPLPAALSGGGSFLQSLSLQMNRQVIGRARWYCPSVKQGVIQLLEISIAESQRRQGHGSRLLKHLLAQAAKYHRDQGAKLRRAFAVLEQKEHVIARAFLSGHGFHHVSTIEEVLKNQDLLVYVRTFV